MAVWHGRCHSAGERRPATRIPALAALCLALPWTAGHTAVSDRTRPELPDVRCVAWSPAGDVVATGDDRGHVTLLDPDSGRVQRTLPTPHGTVRAIAFTRGGAALATAGDDRRIREWSLEGGLLSEWPAGPSVAFSADGSTAAVAARRGLALRRLEADAHVLTLAGAPAAADTLGLSADGSMLAASVPIAWGDVRLGLWDAGTAAPRTWLEAPSYVYGLAFSRDGAWLAAGGDAQDLTLWDLRSRRRARLQHADGVDRVYAVAFAPDGRTLYAGGRFFGARAWDLETRRWRSLVAGGLAVTAIAPSPDGRRLALLRGRWGQSPLVVDAETGRTLWAHVDRQVP